MYNHLKGLEAIDRHNTKISLAKMGYKKVVYCKECIHRPVYDEEENDLIVPPYNNEHQDCACPYICQEDFYLSRMPDKDFYCKFGERKNEF